MSNLYAEWIRAKEAERIAVEHRRWVEDGLIEELCLPEVYDGTKSWKADGYKVKVTYRTNRRIDAELLQEIASENDLSGHLGSLFRWKPEIAKKEWDACDLSIKSKLEGAITTSVGRPSFSIEAVGE